MVELHTVLVIDDDNGVAQLIATVLEDQGYHVETAANGCEGFELVKRGMPDLILLDVQMPVMDGCEFANQFHATYDSDTPIVLVTANSNARALAKQMGAADYVRKPFDVSTLLNAVSQHIKAA